MHFFLPGLATPLLCLFIFEFANLVYPNLWAFWMREVFDWPTLYVGLSLAGYGILLALVQGFLLPILIRTIGDYQTLLLGMMAALIGMVGFGFTATVTAVMFFVMAAAVSDLVPPLLTAISSNLTYEDSQGVVQGVIASLTSVAAVLSPILMTSLFQISVDSKGAYFPGAAFIFAALLILMMVPLISRIRLYASK